MKFASTLPSTIEAGDAFPPSRHIPPPPSPSSLPRQTGGGKLARVVNDQAPAPLESTQRPAPRYRVSSSRFAVPRKTGLITAEPQLTTGQPPDSQPTQRLFRKKLPTSYRTTLRPLIDPIDDSRFNSEPGQPILQRSIQNARPLNKLQVRNKTRVNGGKDNAVAKGEESVDVTGPTKPTRRTFTRKPSAVTTTPANVRVTKRYHKKNSGLKVETTTSSAGPSTTEAVKPFRVATRHQRPIKSQPLKTTGKKKLDDTEEGDNYPEHFKLLLRNHQVEEPNVKATKAAKVNRIKERIESTTSPQDHSVHPALRKSLKPKPRSTVKIVPIKHLTTTTDAEIPSTTSRATTVHQEVETLNFVDEDEEIQQELPFQERIIPNHREGRTKPASNERVGVL